MEELILKLKLQYFGYLMQRVDSLEKMSDARKDWEQEGATENEMVGCHHQCNGHEFEQTPGDGEGQVDTWHAAVHGVTESDTTYGLSNILVAKYFYRA